MKVLTRCLLILVLGVFFWNYGYARAETVTSDKLTIDDIETALLAGTIASDCSLRGFPEYGATSLNPDTLIIKGIRQNSHEATIHFMGRFKESVMADERPVVCEAHLQRLASGEWVDPDGAVLMK